MFVYDFAQVGPQPDQVATWIESRRPQIGVFAKNAWNGGIPMLPVSDGEFHSFDGQLGNGFTANGLIRYPLVWSVMRHDERINVLQGDLSVAPYGPASHVEIHGSCNDLNRYTDETETDSGLARRVMLSCSRDFLAFIAQGLASSQPPPMSTLYPS